jgi:hypothetical protein
VASSPDELQPDIRDHRAGEVQRDEVLASAITRALSDEQWVHDAHTAG